MNFIGAISMAVMGFGTWAFVPGAREFLYDRIAFFVVGIAMYIWGGVQRLNHLLYTRITYLLVCLFIAHAILTTYLNSFHAGYAVPALVIGQMLSLCFRRKRDSYLFASLGSFVAVALALYIPDTNDNRTGLIVFLLLISLLFNVLLISFKSDFIDHIKLNRDMLRSMVNVTETAIFVTDIRGHILDCNQRALDLFAYSRDQLVGRDFRMLRRKPLEESEIIEGLEELENSRFWNSEAELVKCDRSVVDAHLSITMLRSIDQRYLVYRIRDNSSSRAFEKELLRAKDQAESAAAVRSQFLASISHEIRTPLNGVIGMCSLLDYTPLNFRQKEYVDTIQKSGRSLMVLINDILDYSKLENGRFTIREEDIQLDEALLEVCDLLRPHAEQKGIRLDVNLDSDLPEMISTDGGRLKQVLLNLVGNAVKFTDRGFVRVECKLVSRVEECVCLQFEVSDSGIGIAENDQMLLFKPFSQVSAGGDRKFGGTGLGLAISREIIELLGGDIRVLSKEGLGSTFIFSIQAKVSSENQNFSNSQADLELEQLLESERKSLRVLIAEDNLINQSVLLYMLEVLRIKADVVANGNEVIRQVALKRYDIIFMDVQMPVMDGLLASAWIRAHSSYQPYIISMTANSSQDDKHRSAQAGMNDFVPKPFDMAKIRLALLRWFEKRRGTTTTAA